MLELRQIESFFPEYLRGFKRNLLREYLQYKILDAVFSGRYGQKLAFMGGTAIHIAHGLPRFSEDLDFDNLGLSRSDFRMLTRTAAKRLSLEGYVIETGVSFSAKENIKRTAKIAERVIAKGDFLEGAFSADIKIRDLLFESGLSGHRGEKILIKIDAEPQKFKYVPQRVVINKFDVFLGINVVPADILLAQKFYAILARKRAMGRDFYDAVFLAGKAKPDFSYLKERAGISDKEGLKSALLEVCAKLDFKLLARDVEPFLFSPDDAKKVLLFLEYVKGW